MSGFEFFILSKILSILFIEAHPKGSGGAETVVKTTEICGNIPEPDTFDLFRNKRVFIETYGCRYNFGDTAKLAEILKHKGCTFEDSAKEADAIIINTCTVVGTTERRMLRRLSMYREYDLFVTGCMPVCPARGNFCGLHSDNYFVRNDP